MNDLSVAESRSGLLSSSIPKASLTRPHGFRRLAVEGTLPEHLRGTLYRVGPGLLERFGQRVGHPFEADGYVAAMRLDGKGGAYGASRVIESSAYREEEARGHALYGSRAAWPRRVWNSVRGRTKNTANTSAFTWQGRLFALMEGAVPTEVSPEDLTTIGENDLGVVPQTFSAHPHRVAALECTFNFGVRYGRNTEIDLFAMPDRGPARRLTTVTAPFPAVVHDFAVSARHIVLLVCPARIVIWKALLQLGSFSDWVRWEPELGVHVIVVPLEAPDTSRRTVVEPFWVWHVANAFERGKELVIDLARHPDIGSLTSIAGGTPATPPALYRARLDPASLHWSMEELWSHECEFPRVHPAAEGNAYRDCWLTAQDVAGREGVARFDVESGQSAWWIPEAGEAPSEPVLVPRGKRERDAWVLTLVDSGARGQSYIAVLDAEAPGAGPVARVWFDQTLPRTFHGVWLEDASPARMSD